MTETDSSTPAPGGGLRPVTIQRLEGGAVAALALAATIMISPGMWWFPLALFLVFDLSMVGYARSTALGAALYNAVHTYVWPAVLGAAALLVTSSAPGAARWLALVALAWGFHVGVDRALGYGLKLPDAFTHTHLGRIGRPDASRSGER